MIPKPLYEILPIFYVIAGIFAMTSVESMMSFLSGLIMGIAGIIVLTLRRNFRNQNIKS